MSIIKEFNLRILSTFSILMSTNFCGFISCTSSYGNSPALFTPILIRNIEAVNSQKFSPIIIDHVNNPPHDYANRFNLQRRINPFEVVFEWDQLDYAYSTPQQRQRAISRRDFIPENNLPLGVDLWKNRLFVTTPRWRTGVPSTLSMIQLPSSDKNPPLIPYPSWDWQSDAGAQNPDCTRLMSVSRVWVDECERLWVLDSGSVQFSLLCPPKIVVFNLKTDKPIFVQELAKLNDTNYVNIVVDIRNGECSDAYAYIADASRVGIAVFSLAKGRSWTTYNRFYQPDPDAVISNLNGFLYQWPIAVLGLTLAPLNKFQDRILFFHPLSSYSEYMVSTSVLRNETTWTQDPLGMQVAGAFVPVGDRGPSGQSTASGIDRNNVQYYTLVDKNAIGCWNTNQPYTQENIDIVAQDNSTLIYPIDLKIDKEVDQEVWVLSNQYPLWTYQNVVKIRIHRANVREAVNGTSCDSDQFRSSRRRHIFTQPSSLQKNTSQFANPPAVKVAKNRPLFVNVLNGKK